MIGSAVQRRTPTGRSSMAVLAWAFALFNSVRVLSYLPTMWAIHVSADSTQHSLWTWSAWLGANATMAAWLYEQQGRVADRVVWVNLANAAMCAATMALILVYRL